MTFIKNARIKTMAGPLIENGVIKVQDGKITEIGESSQFAVPEGAEVIDAQGQLVTPGLIDAHTHIGIDEEGVGWEGKDFNETSEAVTPHVQAVDGINSFDQGFHDAISSGVTTVQVLPGSANVVGGLMATLKVKLDRTVDELIIRNPSGLKVAFGENPKRIHGQKGKAPVTRMGVAAMLRETLIQAENYLEKRRKGDGERDLRMEAVGLVLTRDIPLRAHTHRADDIMTAIRIAKEFDVELSIEHATEGHKVAKQLANADVSVTVGPTLSNRSKVELNEISWKTYRILQEAGIDFGIITDHPILPIQHLTTSAHMAVREGLAEEAAWEGLTKNPARILGIDKQVGTLEAGKDADLVIWSGDPIVNDGVALLTMVDGEVIYQTKSFENM